MNRHVLGIDGGTESIRACVFDLQGNPISSASCQYTTAYPKPSWAEQSPQDWWDCLGVASREAVSKSGIDASSICALSIDTTCCTVVALDAAGQAIRPALLWMDMRSASEAAEISACGDPALKVNSGGRGPVSAEWMIPKALWLKRNEPDSFARANHICEYQDFMNLKLTGRLVASLNNVSVRWHYSSHTGWPVSLLSKVGLSELLEKWPSEVLEPGALVGPLTEEAAQHLGLAAGTPVAQGGADAFIGMIGLGVLQPGQLALLTGSSHLHLGMTDKMFHGQGIWGTYEGALLHGVNIVEGGQTSTGSIVNWFKKLLGPEVTYEQLNREAADLPPGCEGLLALDHFQGNRTPHTDPLSRGALTGLTLKHGRAHIFRALLESVAFGTHEILETMRGAGYTPTSITVAGGATRSDLWLQIHSDISNLPLVLTRVADAPMLGCAILAAAVAGLYPSIQAAADAMVHVASVVKPDASRHQQYQAQYQRYKSLYHALAPIVHDAAKSSSTGTQPSSTSTPTQPPTVPPSRPTPAAPIDNTPLPDPPTLPPPSPPSATPLSTPLLPRLSPSILAANFASLSHDVQAVLSAGADWIHVDMFDGTYVENFTIGPPVVASLRQSHPLAFLDCHLAVKEPQKYITQLATAGASSVTFHIEVMAGGVGEAAELSQVIRKSGMRVGVALAPATPAEAVMELVEGGHVDMVLCMTVTPGFGGQAFQPDVLEKVRQLRGSFPTLDIQVDGGINADTALQSALAGANVAVAGTAVYGAKEGVNVAVTSLKASLAHGLHSHQRQ